MKWGLVLAGGGARGFAHIGVLKMLDSWGLKPDMIVGTSMGAIVGGLYACGTTPAELERFLFEEFEIRKYLDRWLLQLDGGLVVKFIQAEDALHTLMLKNSIDSGNKILEILRRLTQNKDFTQTLIPFACNAVDLLSGREVVMDEGSVAEAIRASMSIPVIFKPVHYNGMLLADGGILNNAPIWIARKMGARKILCVRVSKFEIFEEKNLTRGVPILLRAYFIGNNALQECIKNSRAVLEICAYAGNKILDFDRKKEIIQLGENTVLENKNEILKRFCRKKLFSPRKK